MSHHQHLIEQLKSLRLGGLNENLELRLEQAHKEQLTYLDFLALLIQDELQRRNQTKLERRMRKACFAEIKTLEEFDFSFNPSIDRRRLYDLATCRFIEKKENILLCGPVGVGKSHLAQALGHEALRRGYEVRYLQASRLFQSLLAARADLSRDRLMRQYLCFDCLIIDDFGLKPLNDTQADDFYEIVYERYQKGSLIVTSNRALEEWMALLPDPIQANSLMDRLCHSAHQLQWEGESYRRHRRTRSAAAQTGAPAA
jgi:DNA replication protein DnaC